MATIREKTTTFYEAKKVGEEGFKILNKSHEKCILYDTQGRRNSESLIDDEDELEYYYTIQYADGLPIAKISQGIYIGDYTHEMTSENIRIERYVGEDYGYIKHYDGDMLIYECDPGLTYEHKYGYDDKQRIIWRKSAIDDYGDIVDDIDDNFDSMLNENEDFNTDTNTGLDREVMINFELEEYIYQDDTLHQKIKYSCNPLSYEEFFEGEIGENEREVISAVEYKEVKEQNGDEQTVTVKEYNMLDGSLVSKTISIFDADNNILRKTYIPLEGIILVEETIYKYN